MDGDPNDIPKFDELDATQIALALGNVYLIRGLIALFAILYPESSPMRDSQGFLTTFAAPVMRSIVPIIFLLFLLPGIVYGYLSGAHKSTKDMIDSMTKAMQGMSYYVLLRRFSVPCSLMRLANRTWACCWR